MINKQIYSEILNTILTEDNKSQINEMINSSKKDASQELEVSFRGINYADYIKIVEKYVNNVNENDISGTESLDISIMLSNKNTYRVSLKNKSLITDFINTHFKSSNEKIQEYLVSLKQSDDIELMYKNRGAAERMFIEDFNIVFKLTTETPVNAKNPPPKLGKVDDEQVAVLTGTEKMLFRYKQRVSFKLNSKFRLDATEVQESKNIWNLAEASQTYELELEAINQKITIDDLSSNVIDVLRVIQNSTAPIGKKEAAYVIDAYKYIHNIKRDISTLLVRNVISVENQHVVNFIPHSYAVTDKVDGERGNLIFLPRGIYFISTLLVVKKTAYVTDNPIYLNMILDGEIATDSSTDKQCFLIFDLIYANNISYMDDAKHGLIHRLDKIKDIAENCLGTLIPFPDYMDKHKDTDLTGIVKFYSNELKKYWKKFREHLAKSEDLFITRKIYFVPYGIDPSEIFMYATMIWKLYVYDDLPPYKLDGMIYTPQNTPYMTNADSKNFDTKPHEYKWKPPNLNSIDFFIKFEKNETTQSDSIYFDKSDANKVVNQYKVCKLFVHTQNKMNEIPIPFKINGAEQTANIYINDGDTRDIEGKIIEDNTVVEFIFDTTQKNVNNAYKWIPLRTRYDKTESVIKYGTKYGNHYGIANRIWKTIINPITEENIATLGNPNTYKMEMDRLAKMTNNILPPKPDAYYAKSTLKDAGMNAFHNWIKSNMITTYAQNKPTLLDIGVGRGGDIHKFINANIGEVVGIDSDIHGLFNGDQSASTRYKTEKAKRKNVPTMHFINANAKGLFNVKSQLSIIPNMSNENKKMIDTYLSGNKKYSVINCQFSMHYYLSDTIAWSNFCKNLLDHLEDDGYLLLTCFDGKLIHEKLKDKKGINISYTSDKGIKNTFLEIIKLYTDEDPIGIGLGIDVYNSVISDPGTYNTEYLVDPQFLENSLRDNCNLKLVESDSFYNIYNLYKKYFTLPSSTEYLVGDAVGRHEVIKKYYMSMDPENRHLFTAEEVDYNLAGFKMSSLNRYYVFKKEVGTDLTVPARIVSMNFKIDLGKIMIPYFYSNNIYIDPGCKNDNINSIYKELCAKSKILHPNVYVIRHNITENIIDNDVFNYNRFEMARIKEGTDPKVLIIYKSPDKKFYPLFYQSHNPAMETIVPNKYFFDNKKIVGDLDFLIELSNKLNLEK